MDTDKPNHATNVHFSDWVVDMPARARHTFEKRNCELHPTCSSLCDNIGNGADFVLTKVDIASGCSRPFAYESCNTLVCVWVRDFLRSSLHGVCILIFICIQYMILKRLTSKGLNLKRVSVMIAPD